ncbi:SCO family protein [Chromatiaceae bacterium AAb-1]|nr:SCO family protein [Chromatiaceae bacterium AAb-1]
MKSSVILAPALLLAAALAAVYAAGGQAQSHDHHHDHSAHQHHQHTTLKAATVNQQDSIYHLAASWTDHHQKTLALADFQGQPVIISMIYGSCRTACPLLVNDARNLFDALPATQQQQTRVVFVSFDTNKDTPAELADYASRLGISSPNWHFLHGADNDIRSLAMLLGIRFRAKDDGTFDHSNVISILDTEGRIAYRSEGLRQPPEPALAALAKIKL